MKICAWILEPIIIVIRLFVRIVREIVTTVWELVCEFITVVKEVVEKVCKWLPWPLDKLCDWVTKLIEVIEKVCHWVKKEIIDRFFEWVEIILEYVFYVLHWVCWLIDWPLRLIDLIFCLLLDWIGIHHTRFLPVCVKILANKDGSPVMTIAEVEKLLEKSKELLRKCNIELIVTEITVVQSDHLRIECNFSNLFSSDFVWFSSHAEHHCLTIYVVEEIKGARGCSYPGSEWVVIDKEAAGCTPVHEFGHLSDLWGHSDDPKNLMHAPCGEEITSWQCCMMRTSRFVSILSHVEHALLATKKKIAEHTHSHDHHDHH